MIHLLNTRRNVSLKVLFLYERLIFDNYFPGCSMMFSRNLAEKIIPIRMKQSVMTGGSPINAALT
jgi:hypothetical protein